MSIELETAAAEAVAHLSDGSGSSATPHVCANCATPMQGRFCHTCGQNSDTHKRSILHLAWEAIEGLTHLDGRLLRTLPALFFRPGDLAKDYMQGRIARHVPPFRTFLVALLLFIFAAEHLAHEAARLAAEQSQAQAAALATPQGRARASASLRQEAVRDHQAALVEATKDRADDLKDPDEARAGIEARYARATQRAQKDYIEALAEADRVAQGIARPSTSIGGVHVVTRGADGHRSWFSEGLHKATANPEYYMTVAFTWGHRLAALLLPILALSLALVYRRRRQYFVYDHLLVAMNLLSFAFLILALAMVLPQTVIPYALEFAGVGTLVNLYQTLRGAYGSSRLGAALKTVLVWSFAVVSFCTLLAGLLVFTLTQL